MSWEWQLIVGIVAFYVFDSVNLLYADEVTFHTERQAWRYKMAGTRWLLLGRSVWVPKLFAPHAPVLRAAWSPTASIEVGDHAFDPPWLKPGIEQGLAFALLVAVILLVPAALVFSGNMGLLAALACTYALICLQLIQIWRHRHCYALATKQFWLLAADSLLCAPFAINAYRKLTMRSCAGRDALDIACSVLPPAQLDVFIGELIAKVEAHMQMHDEDDPMFGMLRTYKAKIEGLQS